MLLHIKKPQAFDCAILKSAKNLIYNILAITFFSTKKKYCLCFYADNKLKSVYILVHNSHAKYK